MKKILILGVGLVGRPISLDLARDNDKKVAIADLSKERLDSVQNRSILKVQADLSDKKELTALVSEYDLIVNAVPGFMGFETLKTCIEAGKDAVDIAFYPEDAFLLSDIAKKKGVRVIVDMGVAPGMSNLLAGYAASLMEKVEAIGIFVGGLPKKRTLPWEYKAVFSPSDVIEEYTRVARLVENGKIVEKPALTEIELLNFDEVGTLEAFNSDGLRSLLFTLKANRMREKTLRYPGYTNKIKLLAENGFFNKEKIEIGNQQVSPLELTSQLLFKQWKLMPGEADLTVMRIEVEGIAKGKLKKHTFDLYDEFDPLSEIHSMARTTGYAASMAVRLLLSDNYRETGITVAEFLGSNEDIVNFMLNGLKERNVIYKEKIEFPETGKTELRNRSLF
jgi:saccharopine dehydrogenase-like NADP-dependent oxidoreductase